MQEKIKIEPNIDYIYKTLYEIYAEQMGTKVTITKKEEENE